ncbi:uncharacterized protein LOC116291441 [Actinia tenebrosa]|uniref:Uncharacterized protein LOC116291441 n=1 Tax=Actinia tenebrosa TaxID=6105 RepID=A0A6P8HFC3_ACTTE|nr:uncharacterized protein LOC116291441 [Actinia tenebrosa]
MLRFKQQSRRDHVVSLLPPISVIKNKEPSVQERIYSDDPPPIAYTGSFPAKVLRHLDKSTFYSTPTKGETLLAKKTMHDEERRTEGINDVIRTEDKDSRNDHDKKNKAIKSKIKKKGIVRKVDGMMKEDEVRCSSAPGFRQKEQRRELPLETGNLTAPVTPRFNAPIIDTRKSARKTSRVYTPTRSTTPRGFASPDLGSAEQDTEVVLELRGDRIEAASLVKDFWVDSTPTSRVGTPCRLDWHGRIPEQGASSTRPKVRSAIREVPCAQKRIEKIPRTAKV